MLTPPRRPEKITRQFCLPLKTNLTYISHLKSRHTLSITLYFPGLTYFVLTSYILNDIKSNINNTETFIVAKKRL